MCIRDSPISSQSDCRIATGCASLLFRFIRVGHNGRVSYSYWEIFVTNICTYLSQIFAHICHKYVFRFIRVGHNGRVSYSQRLTVTARCRMDLSKFPHDSQVIKWWHEDIIPNDEDIMTHKWSNDQMRILFPMIDATARWWINLTKHFNHSIYLSHN